MSNSESKNFIYVDFSNKQIYNNRNINKNGKDIEIVSVSLPKSSQYSGYHIDANAKAVKPSKYNNKMSYIGYKEDTTVSIRKYDKETNTTDKIDLSVEELKQEFDSWKNKEQDSQQKDKESVEEDKEPDIGD